jgi:hypothetical protein
VQVPLKRIDAYADRAVTVIGRDGKKSTECTKLISYEGKRKELVCETVSGSNKTFLINSIRSIFFPLAIKQGQGQVSQSALWTKMSSKPKEILIFTIPGQSMKIAEGAILLNSSWISPSNIQVLTPYSEKNGKVETTTILEPTSLTYQPLDNTFLFKGQYVEYSKETIKTTGGGGGGKGGGRSRRQN